MDFAFSKLLLIFVIGLLVLGPHKLAQVAKVVGKLIARAQRHSAQFWDQVRQMEDALPTKKDLGIDQLTDLKSHFNNIGNPFTSAEPPSFTQPASPPSAEEAFFKAKSDMVGLPASPQRGSASFDGNSLPLAPSHSTLASRARLLRHQERQIFLRLKKRSHLRHRAL